MHPPPLPPVIPVLVFPPPAHVLEQWQDPARDDLSSFAVRGPLNFRATPLAVIRRSWLVVVDLPCTIIVSSAGGWFCVGPQRTPPPLTRLPRLPRCVGSHTCSTKRPR